MSRSGARRRLLLVSTNYAPEHAGIGPYATQIAEHWAARRRRDPRPRRHAALPRLAHRPGVPGALRRTEERVGGRACTGARHTVPAAADRRAPGAVRGVDAAHGARAAPPADAGPTRSLAQMPSLAGGVLGRAAGARAAKVPFVPVVQDLMGAAAAQSGIRGGGRAAAARRPRPSATCCGGATLVGVIHESFVERVTAMGVAARPRSGSSPTGRTSRRPRGRAPRPAPASAGPRARP